MSAFDKAKETAGDIVEKVEEKIPDSVKEKLGDAKVKAGEIVEKVEEKFGDAKVKVGEIVDKLEDKLPDAVKNKVEPITDKIFGKDRPDDAAAASGESG